MNHFLNQQIKSRLNHILLHSPPPPPSIHLMYVYLPYYFFVFALRYGNITKSYKWLQLLSMGRLLRNIYDTKQNIKHQDCCLCLNACVHRYINRLNRKKFNIFHYPVCVCVCWGRLKTHHRSRVGHVYVNVHPPSLAWFFVHIAHSHSYSPSLPLVLLLFHSRSWAWSERELESANENNYKRQPPIERYASYWIEVNTNTRKCKHTNSVFIAEPYVDISLGELYMCVLVFITLT